MATNHYWRFALGKTAGQVYYVTEKNDIPVRHRKGGKKKPKK